MMQEKSYNNTVDASVIASHYDSAIGYRIKRVCTVVSVCTRACIHIHGCVGFFVNVHIHISFITIDA